MARKATQRRRVCFVTGTRAEFGLMRSVLRAIGADRRLSLQIVATGMHLSRSHGYTLQTLRDEGWDVSAVVPWTGDVAVATGRAVVGLTQAFERLSTEVVLVAGDRVEAFAGATAGHLSGRVVAHVHGGDRAMGQVDDTLRHAITKLSHVHFPATRRSAQRLIKLGEQRERIFECGSPGVDGITQAAATMTGVRRVISGLKSRAFALVLLHPTLHDDADEYAHAMTLMNAVLSFDFDQVVVVYPNNDPGCDGIIRAWDALAERTDGRITFLRNATRDVFLGLLREAAVLVGNSSAGIIEAGSFSTPVIDIGLRQFGRERSREVIHVDMNEAAIRRAMRRVWRGGDVARTSGKNVYGGDGTGRKIANTLAQLTIDRSLLRKIIAY